MKVNLNQLKVFIGGLLLITSFVVLQSSKTGNPNTLQRGEWVAPASADNLKNPIKDDAAKTAAGKKLYKKMCAICHGNSGRGDGMAGMSLNPRPSNFTSEKVQKQTDGAIYWKLTEGRAPMAGYKDLMEEEERWQLVNYIRTLNK